MQISVITVTRNSSRTIARTVNSVSSQHEVNVEHIIKDACSIDRTIEFAQCANSSVVVISKPDIGIYDAMNQGFLASTGEVVAFLNSDDYYIDRHVLSDVVKMFNETDCDFVYGNITMTSPTGEIVREWHSDLLDDAGLVGRQIPHPAIFIKREVLNHLTLPFDSSYRIAADLKQQLVIINHLKFKGKHLNRSLVIMETGGTSTHSFSSYFMGWT